MGLSPHQDVHCITLDGFVKENDSRELEAQFTSLVTRQSRFVFCIAYAMVRNTHDAEDIVQETFMKLYRTGAWKTMQDEKAFLARTAWRIAIESRPAKSKATEGTDTIYSLADNPEAHAMKSDTQRLVHALINALPDELRLPLALSTIEEFTSAEIGLMMNVPDGTVRSRLARARQILKEKLEHVLGVRGDRTR